MAQLTAVSSPVVQRHTPWNRKAVTCDVWCEAFAPHVANSQGEAPQYVPHHRTRAVIVDFSSSRLGRLIARLGRLIARLGRLIARLGRLIARLGRLLARLGRLSARLGRLLARLGRLLARLGRLREI